MISTRLKELRQEKGLTQTKLAKELGYSQSQISQWENNINEPTASAIIKLSDYFNVCADYLLGRKDFY